MQSLHGWALEPVSVLVSGFPHLKTNSLCTAWNFPGVCQSPGGFSENACLNTCHQKRGFTSDTSL